MDCTWGHNKARMRKCLRGISSTLDGGMNRRPHYGTRIPFNNHILNYACTTIVVTFMLEKTTCINKDIQANGFMVPT